MIIIFNYDSRVVMCDTTFTDVHDDAYIVMTTPPPGAATRVRQYCGVRVEEKTDMVF